MKRLNFNIKDRKVLTLGLCLVAICVFTLTIAYAALNAVLTIQGSAQVTSTDWDIHLANPKVTNGSVSGTTPSITSPTTATFSPVLNIPGDFYEFTIDVVNSGSIDAMIDSVTKEPTLTIAQAKYLKYEVSYQNGESINTKQLVEKDSFVRLKVRVEFRKDIITSDLPISSETLNLAFTVNYLQSDGSGSGVNNNGGTESSVVRVVNGDGTQTGDEICIGEECFYVMYSDDNSVTMLTKYNLYVGNSVDEDWNLTPLSNPTGIQDEDAKGYNLDNEKEEEILPFIGTTVFSDTSIEYSGSIVEGYVNNYNSYLITQGVTPIEARLITKDELINLGCSEDGYRCFEAPEWVYATTYWTGSANLYDYVYYVFCDGTFGNFLPYDDAHEAGVRPVITISRSNF